MSTDGFGRMVEGAMRAKGWSQRRLGAEIGVLPGGRIFDATQVRLIIQGRRRYYDTDLVERLISVLDLDPDEAWHAAGLWPPDLDVAGYRRLRELAASELTNQVVRMPIPDELGELVRRLRPLAIAA